MTVLFLVWPGGCATTDNLRKTQRDYDSRTSGQRGDADILQARFDRFGKNYTETMRAVRENQANLNADVLLKAGAFPPLPSFFQGECT